MKITASNIGCNIGGVPANILAYADDMVLMDSTTVYNSGASRLC